MATAPMNVSPAAPAHQNANPAQTDNANTAQAENPDTAPAVSTGVEQKPDFDPMIMEGIHAEHGAQVVLNRAASAAARGGLKGSIRENIEAKRAMEAAGDQADGHSVDGTSVTGKRQPDDVLADVTNDPAGPPTGVRPREGNTVSDAAGLAGTDHTPTPDGKGGPAGLRK